jgi:predicted membrane channel-forming protein YqfA (hemolysin III family)
VVEGLMPEGFHVMCAKIGTTSAAKPLLRGYSHAAAAILVVLGTVWLLPVTADDPHKQLTMLIYGAVLQDVVPCVRR